MHLICLQMGDVVYIHGACFLWVPIIILDFEISVVHLHHRVVLVILPQCSSSNCLAANNLVTTVWLKQPTCFYYIDLVVHLSQCCLPAVKVLG